MCFQDVESTIMKSGHSTSLLCAIGMTMVLLTGCQSSVEHRMSFEEVRSSVVILDVEDKKLSWEEMIGRTDEFDVIVLGEIHDDHVAHLVQRAVVEDVAKRRVGSVLAMEMLERDEQILIDDYRDGLITAEDFTKLTFSGSWAGEGSWDDWYLPIIDVAHENGASVIAANAPRRYVRIARTDGFERLDELPDDRRGLVEWPDPPIGGHYRKRFMDLMSSNGEEEIDMDVAEAFFRAQQTWDATMAGSVVETMPGDDGASILMLGRFHSDHDGGTVGMIRRLAPEVGIIVISLGPPDEDGPDGVRADIVIESDQSTSIPAK
tara:strand:+ start:19316 stop:20275 length:960 start_codon:yes stop_codon:yes gene_type:complete